MERSSCHSQSRSPKARCSNQNVVVALIDALLTLPSYIDNHFSLPDVWGATKHRRLDTDDVCTGTTFAESLHRYKASTSAPG